jgi:hypothetical protein
MITTFEQAETVLNELIEDYLSGLGDNCSSEGNIDWGGGVLGYESEKQLLQDLITYIQNK